MDTKEAECYIRSVADNNMYTIKVNNFDRMVENFTTMKKQEGEYYCPCQVGKTDDTICPCVFMREHGACRCGLYKKGR